MEDRLEARISAVENIQEEFGHDIRKVKEHLARLTSLFEDYIKTQVVHSRGPSSAPIQRASHPSPRPFGPAMSNLLLRTYCPNLQPSKHTLVITAVHARTPVSSNKSSSLESHPKLVWIGSDGTPSLSHMLSYSPS